MAFSLDVKGLLAAGSVSIVSLVAVQGSVQAEPAVSSYYGDELAGNPTASGEPFDPRSLTAAHPSLPLGTMLTVSYNGRSVDVRVNDRGPHAAGRDLDISLAAAQTLGLTGSGASMVDIKPAGAPETNPPVPESKTTEPARAVSSARTAATSSQRINAHYGPTFFEEPPATKVPEITEDQDTETPHARLTVPGRRRAA